jgi:hypothetical protein
LFEVSTAAPTKDSAMKLAKSAIAAAWPLVVR